MAQDRTNIKIEPMIATYGENVAQVQKITCRADSGGDLNNDWFAFYLPSGAKHYCWFNVASGGTDPAIAGATAHEVAIASGASASAVASAVEAVLEAITGIASDVSGSVITVTFEDTGYAPLAHEGVGTGFSFEMVTEGDAAVDLGFTDGDIECSFPEDLVDVTAHQTGTNVLSQIRTGKQVEITITLKETSKTQIRNMLRNPGAAFTPAGANGTEVFGLGASKDFTQTFVQAKKLVLHPVVLGASDKSRDVTFHKAYPILESLAFSGENILMLPVNFKVYQDLTKNRAISYFAIGDSSQTLT